MSEAEQTVQPSAGYILVALDASPHSEAALAAAAELAAALQLDLRGLFVEDVNLLRLCGLPFGLEFGSFTASPRRLVQSHIEREFRVQAALLRKSMADVAGKRQITWSFQVVRGGVTDTLLDAATSARMLSLGRVGRSPGKRTGTTAQAVAHKTQRPVLIQSTSRHLTGPFIAVYTGTQASANGLTLAAQLAIQRKSSLVVLVIGNPPPETLNRQLADIPVQVDVHLPAALGNMIATLRLINSGTIILPIDVATLLDEIRVPVIVVP